MNVAPGSFTRTAPHFGANEQPANPPTVIKPEPKKSDAVIEAPPRKTLLSRLGGLYTYVAQLWTPDPEKRRTRDWEVQQKALEAEYLLKAKEPTAKLKDIDTQIISVNYEISMLQGLYDRFEQKIVYVQSKMEASNKEWTQKQVDFKESRELLNALGAFYAQAEPERKLEAEKRLIEAHQKMADLLDKDLRPSDKVLKLKPDMALLNLLLDQQEKRIADVIKSIGDYFNPRDTKDIEGMRDYQKRYTEDMAPMKEQLAKLEKDKAGINQALAQLDTDKKQALALAQGQYETELKAIQLAKISKDSSNSPANPDVQV